MNTVTTSSLHTETLPGTVARSKNRNLLILGAFWHTLRRDLVTTARGFIPFVLQVLVQPVSLLFIFGRVMPGVGTTQQIYPALFFPGVVALTIFVASIQGITLTLIVDLNYNHEIDDRLLAPLPVSLVAIEKVVFAAIFALVAGIIIFPIASLVLGSGYQVRTDALLPLLGIMVLYALSCASLGLVIGAAFPAEKINLLFPLVLTTSLYTGCVYYTWNSVGAIKVLQILALTNPLTYASEGLRYTMVPLNHGQALATLPIGWVLVGLLISLLLLLVCGIQVFHRRVIS